MKRFILILLSIFILTSCAKKEVVDTEDVDNKEDEETITYPNTYDNTAYEEPLEYKESLESNNTWIFEGSGEYSRELNIKNISIHDGDNEASNTKLYVDNVLIKSGSNTISFNISSTISKSINISVGSYLNKKVELKEGYNEFSYDFDCPSDDNVSVIFELGDKSSTSHTIKMSDLAITSSNNNISARVNQVGYLSKLEKEVTFIDNPGDYFYVCKKDTGEVIYTGDISLGEYENDSDEIVYKGFFKEVKDSGEYYIRSELGSYSYDFKIGSDIYEELDKDVLYFIYLQRCGMDIEDDKYGLSHPACHTADSKVWTSLEEKYINTTGGWHDAGDYGKYLTTINKTIADLLYAYKYGDNKSDEVLDEARYGLEFILKLQNTYGGVYNKVGTMSFSSFISPEEDTAQTYALWPWTASTASFAGVTGVAYQIYKDIDEEFANRCLDAHNLAVASLLVATGPSNEGNPEEFSIGTYYVDDESDDRLFAYSLAYANSGDPKYIDLINNILNNGLDRSYNTLNSRVFAYACLLDTLNENDELYIKISEMLKEECDTLADGVTSNGYAYPLSEYYWGSNGYVCDSVSELLLGARYLNEDKYKVKASEAFNYVLGMNTLNMCFVQGYGTNAPLTIHSRLARSKGVSSIKGALANGVDQYLTEGILADYFTDDSPIATRFIDNRDSYTSVEPTIYYNAALVLSLSLLEYANNN